MRSFQNRKQITDRGLYVLFPFGPLPPVGFVYEDFEGLKQADNRYWMVTSLALLVLAGFLKQTRNALITLTEYVVAALVIWALQIILVALVMPKRRFYAQARHGALFSKVHPRSGQPLDTSRETHE